MTDATNTTSDRCADHSPTAVPTIVPNAGVTTAQSAVPLRRPPRWQALSKRHKGKWFNSMNGYGFIRPEDGGAQSAIQAEGYRSLADDEPVEFDLLVECNGVRRSQRSGKKVIM